MSETNAKKLIKQALKAAPKKQLALAELERTVIAQLIAEGKSQKKAAKLFAAKLVLPCFTSTGSVVTITPKEEAVSEAPPKRKEEAAAEAPPSKRNKVAPDAEAAQSKKKGGPSTASTASTGPMGTVRMMDENSAAAFFKEHRITLSCEDGSCDFRPCSTFADAGFSKEALKACSKFAKPTPIQSCVWPIMMAARDVIGVAETGSGKTLAFFLPAMMHCSSLPASVMKGANGPIVLVLSQAFNPRAPPGGGLLAAALSYLPISPTCFTTIWVVRCMPHP